MNNNSRKTSNAQNLLFLPNNHPSFDSSLLNTNNNTVNNTNSSTGQQLQQQQQFLQPVRQAINATHTITNNPGLSGNTNQNLNYITQFNPAAVVLPINGQQQQNNPGQTQQIHLQRPFSANNTGLQSFHQPAPLINSERNIDGLHHNYTQNTTNNTSNPNRTHILLNTPVINTHNTNQTTNNTFAANLTMNPQNHNIFSLPGPQNNNPLSSLKRNEISHQGQILQLSSEIPLGFTGISQQDPVQRGQLDSLLLGATTTAVKNKNESLFQQSGNEQIRLDSSFPSQQEQQTQTKMLFSAENLETKQQQQPQQKTNVKQHKQQQDQKQLQQKQSYLPSSQQQIDQNITTSQAVVVLVNQTELAAAGQEQPRGKIKTNKQKQKYIKETEKSEVKRATSAATVDTVVASKLLLSELAQKNDQSKELKKNKHASAQQVNHIQNQEMHNINNNNNTGAVNQQEIERTITQDAQQFIDIQRQSKALQFSEEIIKTYEQPDKGSSQESELNIIDTWIKKIGDEKNLYQMTLTGHLIKAIQFKNGEALLSFLITTTIPFLKSCLRKKNGKIFDIGDNERIIKGALSEYCFYKSDNNNDLWKLNQEKLQIVISDTNEKIKKYLLSLNKIKRKPEQSVISQQKSYPGQGLYGGSNHENVEKQLSEKHEHDMQQFGQMGGSKILMQSQHQIELDMQQQQRHQNSQQFRKKFDKNTEKLSEKQSQQLSHLEDKKYDNYGDISQVYRGIQEEQKNQDIQNGGYLNDQEQGDLHFGQELQHEDIEGGVLEQDGREQQQQMALSQIKHTKLIQNQSSHQQQQERKLNSKSLMKTALYRSSTQGAGNINQYALNAVHSSEDHNDTKKRIQFTEKHKKLSKNLNKLLQHYKSKNTRKEFQFFQELQEGFETRTFEDMCKLTNKMDHRKIAGMALCYGVFKEIIDRNVRQIAETQDEEYKMLNQRKKLLKEALQII